MGSPFREVIPTEAKQLPPPPTRSPFLSACPQSGTVLVRKDGIGTPLDFCRVFRFQLSGGGLVPWRPDLSLDSRMFILVS